MNKGDLVECCESIGKAFINKASIKENAFTKGRVYEVLAGYGDGDISRSDGRIGAFIINDYQMCIKDDFGTIRLIKCDHRFNVVHLSPTANKRRVPVTHLYKPTKNRFIPRQVLGEFSHADANP
ncbi:hypothetical protein Erwinia_phage_Aioli_00073 [Erwinia phage Aioli]|nr:hypothetical protein Erwinia_phage_Aioli_00073 [Erwinia phage Aioli]